MRNEQKLKSICSWKSNDAIGVHKSRYIKEI